MGNDIELIKEKERSDTSFKSVKIKSKPKVPISIRAKSEPIIVRNERSNSNVSGNVFAGLRKSNTQLAKTGQKPEKKKPSNEQAWEDPDLNNMFNKRSMKLASLNDKEK